jgi:tetratricopeptide (TPR) repeat protein
MSIFKKKEIYQVKSVEVDPTEIAEPKDADDFLKRGMAYYARKQYEDAEKDLNKAIELNPNFIDAYYSVGMVYKAENRKDDAIKAFQRAINLIETDEDETKSAGFDMLRKLALGHVNEISQGDWNLEKEIWQHEE